MSDLTYEEVLDIAVADHAAHVGKVLAVNHAQLGGPSDEDYVERYFVREPLLVRVTNELSQNDVNDDHWENYKVIDSYWNVEPLPGQLASWMRVSWIHGPTYEASGRRTWPELVRIVEPLDVCRACSGDGVLKDPSRDCLYCIDGYIGDPSLRERSS